MRCCCGPTRGCWRQRWCRRWSGWGWVWVQAGAGGLRGCGRRRLRLSSWCCRCWPGACATNTRCTSFNRWPRAMRTSRESLCCSGFSAGTARGRSTSSRPWMCTGTMTATCCAWKICRRARSTMQRRWLRRARCMRSTTCRRTSRRPSTRGSGGLQTSA
jgi:hypothetical protein